MWLDWWEGEAVKTHMNLRRVDERLNRAEEMVDVVKDKAKRRVKNGAWRDESRQTRWKGRRGRSGLRICMRKMKDTCNGKYKAHGYQHIASRFFMNRGWKKSKNRKTLYVFFYFTSIACWNCSCSFCSCSASCNELAVIRPAFSMDSPLRIQPST